MHNPKGRRSYRDHSIQKQFHDRIDKTGPCWEWLWHKCKAGYGKIAIHGKVLKAHRFSYEYYKGPIHDGLFVLHSCDNPGCVNPEHLSLGNAKDNGKDMAVRKRSTFGERNYHAKLTTESVLSIREQRSKGATYNELSVQFGVSSGYINHIVNRRKWKHI